MISKIFSRARTTISKKLPHNKKVVLREHKEGFTKTTFKKVSGAWSVILHEEWEFKDVRITRRRGDFQ